MELSFLGTLIIFPLSVFLYNISITHNVVNIGRDGIIISALDLLFCLIIFAPQNFFLVPLLIFAAWARSVVVIRICLVLTLLLYVVGFFGLNF